MVVILTLQEPTGSRGIPVVTTANAEFLASLSQVVAALANRKVELAEDALQPLLARLQLGRLERALAVLIPNVPTRLRPGLNEATG